jgi:large subunit ribosomal protein L21
MYAIVKTGGKQYKVAEGDVIEVEKLAGVPGDALNLVAVLLVDGDNLVTDAAKLANVTVSGEIAEHTKGPKIRIHKFKNNPSDGKGRAPRDAADVRKGHRQRTQQLRSEAMTPPDCLQRLRIAAGPRHR